MGNGDKSGLEAAWILFNQYKIVGGIIVAVTIFVLSINKDHVDQAEIKSYLKIQAVVQDDVLVRQDKMFDYMRDTLTTNEDINSLLAQAQGVHDDLYKKVNKLEGDGGGYRYGRGIYRKEYGPMPPEKFRNWFWQE